MNADIGSLYNRIMQSKWRRRTLLVHELGRIKQHAFLLLRPDHIDPNLPNVLFTGCFHGDEPSGTFGILDFLENSSLGLTKRANYSFLPIVNPSGLESNKRCNYKKQDPNRGYVDHDKLSLEGKILIKNNSLLTELGRDLVISFHEYLVSTAPDLKGGFMFHRGERKRGMLLDSIYNSIKKDQGLVSAEDLEMTLLDWELELKDFSTRDGEIITAKQCRGLNDTYDDYMFIEARCNETATVELPYSDIGTKQFKKNVRTIKKMIENL